MDLVFRLVLLSLCILVIAGCEANGKGEVQSTEPAIDEEEQTSEITEEPQQFEAQEPEIIPEPDIPFEHVVAIPYNHYLERIITAENRELTVRVREGETHELYVASIDFEKREFQKLGEVENGEAPFEAASPTGEWTVVWDRFTPGLWGIAAETGEKVQWTEGTGDWGPKWLSDGSGFYYLHDTGKNLGDGAGPEHTLAFYDIVSGRKEVLPFEKGFWGWMEWLEPDKSLIAYNGFDDEFAVKVVNLEQGIEKQILREYAFSYVETEIHPTKPLLLVSVEGEFIWYNSEGHEVKRLAWPHGMDPYTRKNDAGESPYYELAVGLSKVGPHYFQFSPDGQHLAYLLGTIGQSIDDRIPGTKLVLSRDDGSEPAFVMEDYVRMMDYAWSPSSDRLFIAFTLDGMHKQAYVTEIMAHGSMEEGES